MNACLFTVYDRQVDGGQERVLSIFLVSQASTLEEVDAAIARELQVVGPVDAVHFVGHPTEITTFHGWLSRADDVLLDRLRGVVHGRDESLRVFAFDPVTGHHSCALINGSPCGVAGLIGIEKQKSLTTLFCNGGGEETAPAGTHYAKTSAKHTDRFLRVSNVLESGANVALVAFWLLPSIWHTSARHVVVDTSGIYSVVLTALQAAAKLGGLTSWPLVWSHKSHDGVDHIPPHVVRDAVFVVSASTSNGLVGRILSMGANAQNVITLFGLSSGAHAGHVVLCDLRSDAYGGVKPIQNHEATDCVFCRKHFHLINIQGDQFSIAPPRVTAIEIKSDDLSERLRSVLSALSGLSAFFAYRRRENGQICSLGLNVVPVLANPVHEKGRALQESVREKWRASVRRSQTLGLRTVVAGTYPGSDLLASEISVSAREALLDATKARVVDSAAIGDEEPQAGTSTIVVSACIDEVNELLAISRALRDVQPGGAIAYLSVAQLMAPKQLCDRLRSNITHGSQGPGTFSYFTALELPVECYEDEPSWRAELDELQRLCAWADAQELDVPEEVFVRISRLQQAPSEGLIADLFWPSASGAHLTLRSDFALIDGSLIEPVVSQADLFAVFCVVVSGLRNNVDGTRRLAHNGYERSVLAPSNFDRFNDGVLQACILRAAHPKDLAYGACDESINDQMLAILKHSLPTAGSPERGEALLEFTVALLTGRVTLTRRAVTEFADALVTATCDTWPVACIMGRYLQAKTVTANGSAPTEPDGAAPMARSTRL